LELGVYDIYPTNIIIENSIELGFEALVESLMKLCESKATKNIYLDGYVGVF